MSQFLSDEILNRMKAAAENHPNLELPPKIAVDMGMEFLAVDLEEKSIEIKMPVKARYENPMHFMQGGIIVAAADNALGPLSHLVAQPNVTTQLNTTFVRPIDPSNKFITVKAWVTEQTKRQIFMRAEVYTQKGKIAAICQATAMVVGNKSS